MMKPSIVIIGIAAVATAAGIAWWLHQTRYARGFDSAAALVKLSRSGITVSVPTDHLEAGEGVSSSELVAHLRSFRKLRPRSSIGIVVFDSNMEADVELVRSQLVDAGFEVAGVMKVGFITEPTGER